MNTDTNELISAKLAAAMGQDQLEAQGFEPLPDGLQIAAALALGALERRVVSKRSGGKLSRYAAKRRKEKRKAAKRAKKQNR